jgi:hypothetical protein
VWSLGVAIFDLLQTLRLGFYDDPSDANQIDFRELSEEGRTVIIKETVQDIALQQLLCKMLSDAK